MINSWYLFIATTLVIVGLVGWYWAEAMDKCAHLYTYFIVLFFASWFLTVAIAMYSVWLVYYIKGWDL